MSIEGANLRLYRQESKLTLRDVSERTGLNITHLSHLELGKIRMSVDVLRQIAKGLELSPADLLGVVPQVMWETCPACDGRGMVKHERKATERGEGREGLERAVCEAAVGFGRASAAHEANLESKGEEHEDTAWTRGRMEDARRRLEHATEEYESYCLEKYERENAEHYGKLAAEARG